MSPDKVSGQEPFAFTYREDLYNIRNNAKPTL